jgi:hypothetical protein
LYPTKSSGEKFDLQPYGSEKATYNIVETTSDIFKVAAGSETMTLVRIPP